jgi:DNA recombination protein RmuC
MNMGVALVSYSMLIPYLLLAFQVALHTASDIEMDRVRSNLHGVKETTEKLQSEVEGRFSRALTMLQNSRDELRGQFGRINTSIAIMEGTSSEAEQQSIVLEAPAAHS